VDARYAFLIALGVAGIWAYFVTEPGYSEAWLMIGIVSLVWALFIFWRNNRKPTGKHFERKN
jgi:arginine exporter protein ArgO